MTFEERFWAKVDVAGPDDCWKWTASKVPGGYGKVWDGNRLVLAHRAAYELLVGPIPDGLVIDHLCRTRPCVNPAHIEPVTFEENVRRGVGVGMVNAAKKCCSRGHQFDEENTHHYGGRRICRICRREALRRHRRKAESEKESSS